MKNLDKRLFVINKERGPSSFAVVDAFRKASGIRKVGHTGTLDPLAEGVLLLVTGRATRAVEHFMDLPKAYEFTIRLGVETTTLDAEGDIVREVPCPQLSESAIVDAARAFVGRYELLPPAYSALKQNGRRLYEMARAGETPQVKGRTVTIHQLDVCGIELPEVRFRIRCSRGTYVRALARDIGERLDLPAHMSHLVRTAIGPFEVAGAYPSRKVFDKDIADLEGIALSDALSFLPGIVIRPTARRALQFGTPPGHRDIVRTIGDVMSDSALRILDEEGRLLAVGTRSEDSPSVLQWVDSFRLFVDPRSLEA